MIPIPTAVLDLLRERGWPAEYNDIPMEARATFGDVPDTLRIEVWCLAADYPDWRTHWFAIARDPGDSDQEDQFVVGWRTHTTKEAETFDGWMVQDYNVLGGTALYLGPIVRHSVDDQYKKYRKEWIHKRFHRIFPSLTMFPIGIVGLVAVIPALVAENPALPVELTRQITFVNWFGGILLYLLLCGLLSWWVSRNQFNRASKHDPIVHTMKKIRPLIG